MSLQVFVSYASPDRDQAETIARQLSALGFSPWIDRWQAVPGESWSASFDRALETADVALVLIGAELSAGQEREVRALLSRSAGVRAVPVLIPRAQSVPPLLADRQYVDLRGLSLDSAAAAAALRWGVVGEPEEPSGEPDRVLGQDPRLDDEISELAATVAELRDGSPERRAARVRLAGLLGMRYTQPGGTDDDRVRAQQIVDDVLADVRATPDERRAMSLLRPVITMLTITPASPLRGHDLATADVLGLVQPWLQGTDPETMVAGLRELTEQLASIPDVAALPEQLRSTLAVLDASVNLMIDVQRPGWDGTVSPEVVQQLRTAQADAPSGVPGIELLGPLLAYLDGPGDPAAAGARAAQLQQLLTDLPADGLLRPVLERDLAGALLADADRGTRPGAVRQAVELVQRALGGMADNHPLRAETRSMLAGALLTSAAYEPTADGVDQAERAVDDLLRRPAADTPADRGSALFLRALIGLLRARVDGDRGAADALHYLLNAIELIPTGHDLRPVAVGQLGAVLADRHLMEGLWADADAASALLERVAAVDLKAGSVGFLRCVAALARINQASRRADPAALAAAAEQLRAGLTRLPDQHLMRPNFQLVLSVAELQLAAGSTDPDRIRAAVTTLQRAANTGTLAGVAPAAAASLAGIVDVLGGLLDHDPAAILRSIERMEAQLATPSAVLDQRVVQWAALGKAYLAAIDAGFAAESLAGRAVTVLEAAVAQLTEHRPGLLRGDLLWDLALAQRAVGAAEPARRRAAEALQARVGDVLLQTGAGHAIVTARGAAADAAILARWCLADGDPASAVRAVELGRGLTLHAATSTLRVPQLLRDLGRPDLAEDWQLATHDPGSAEPALLADSDLARAAGDLRLRVLDVLRRRPECGNLFDAPSVGEIQRAVIATDADALAYLLPGADGQPGQILLIQRDGPPVPITAPQLRDEQAGPLAAFLRAPQPGRNRGFDLGEPSPTWAAALSAVADWAGSAALEPLLTALDRRGGPAPVPRVVLVPGGRLGAVPWAAARLGTGTAQPRYAVQELILSSAASARQLVDVAARPALPIMTAPVLVGDPTGELPGAVDEVLALLELYPDALVLGQVGAAAAPVAPAEVLALLPGPGSRGASLLVFICHARTAATAEDSLLQLTEPLRIRSVLHHGAAREVDAAGPVVVLSTCVSDLTDRDYDEALTLATAFLAAGAVTVVGSRWAVDDRRTAVLMFLFHHHLVVSGQPAAVALRSAQLWMLDPGRPSVPGMPVALLRTVAEGGLEDPAVWAAFGHHGR